MGTYTVSFFTFKYQEFGFPNWGFGKREFRKRELVLRPNPLLSRSTGPQWLESECDSRSKVIPAGGSHMIPIVDSIFNIQSDSS